MSGAKLTHDTSDKCFGVSEQHQVVIEVIERIVDASETRAHTAFDHHHSVSAVDIKDRHTIDRAGRIVARRRIGHVVGSDHEGDVSLWKVTIDFVHLY